MFFYLFLFVCVSIFSFVYSKTKDINLICFSKCFVFLFLFLPTALRYGIGTDYFSYVEIFNGIKNRGIGYFYSHRIEFGYFLLNYWCSSLNLSPQWIFVIMAFLTLFFLFIAIPRRSFYLIIPFYFTTLYAFSYNGMRQALSLTMGYYAYQLLDNKKIFRAFIWVFIASLFHSSAFLYYPVYLVMILCKLQKKQAMILFLFIVLLNIKSNIIIDVIFVNIVFHTQYIDYIFNSEYNTSFDTNIFNIISHYFIFFIPLLFIKNIKDKKKSNMFVGFLAFNFSYLLGSTIKIFDRIISLFQIMWFPVIHCINVNRTKYRKLVLAMIYCWGLFSFIISVLMRGIHEIVPYRTFF